MKYTLDQLVICLGEICLHNHKDVYMFHTDTQHPTYTTESLARHETQIHLAKGALKPSVRLTLESSPAEPLEVFPLGSECTAPFQKLPLKYQTACIADVMFQPLSIACKCSSDNSCQPSPKLKAPNILMGY